MVVKSTKEVAYQLENSIPTLVKVSKVSGNSFKTKISWGRLKSSPKMMMHFLDDCRFPNQSDSNKQYEIRPLDNLISFPKYVNISISKTLYNILVI